MYNIVVENHNTMTANSSHSMVWQPTQSRLKASLIHDFASQVGIDDYDTLHKWSCEHVEDFWSKFWDYCGIIGHKKGPIIFQENTSGEHVFENTRFFNEATLNVGENLLRRRGSAKAMIFASETGVHQHLSCDDVYNRVSQIIQFLKSKGIQSGDRVAGYIPNMPEAVLAMIACASIGAIWTSCSPDFGVQSVVDRLSQTKPKLIFTASGYQYNGKTFVLLDRISEIRAAVPSIETVLVADYPGIETQLSEEDESIISMNALYNEFAPQEIIFEQFPFNHPLLILYSSGTTGVPKCIVHGAGGTLITHMKEHQLQCDIKEDDIVFYFTTCGWMMWNWLVSALASNAAIVLYDGSPLAPDSRILPELINEVNITFFGVSAKYLIALEKSGYIPQKPFASLKSIASTGSPLAPQSYDYVYNKLSKDVHLLSISGGTDIVSCFFIGHCLGPVYRGELQCAGLGYHMDVYNDQASFEDETNKSLEVGVQGELVCLTPFPSQPLYFWNDLDTNTGTLNRPAQNYHKAYFTRYKNVWHHGDRVEKTEHSGYIIHGRSDAVLNPGGVRIGTSEIYRQVDHFPQIMESMAIGQEWQDDIRILLFVLMKEGETLTNELIDELKSQIRKNTTARHVPAKILQISDLPRTKNGKLAEIAARNVLHGVENTNLASLSNPQSLDVLKGFLPQLMTS